MEPEEAIPTGDDNSLGTPAGVQATLPQGDSGAVSEQAISTDEPSYVNQPEGNLIERGNQAAGGFLARTFGPQGPIPNTGTEQQASAPEAQQQGNPGEVGTGGVGKMGRGLKAIVSYLMRAGAVDPSVLQQAANQIDPESGMSASDRNLMVVADAAKRGGPEAASTMLETNAKAFDAKQSFAYVAMTGNQQKRPDIHAAVDAANQASDHVLDGSNTRFMVSTGGQITATVKGADGQTQIFDLSADQFKQYLHPGKDGMWDKLMQPGGIAAALTTITQGQPGQQTTPGQPDTQEQAPAAQPHQRTPKRGAIDTSEPPAMSAFGETADQLTPDGHKPWIPARNGNYGNELENRAAARFPSIGQNNARQDWMAAQEKESNTLQNKIDVEKERGSNWVSRTEAQNQGRVANTQEHNKGSLAVQQEKTGGFKYANDAKVRVAQIKADQEAAKAGSKDAQARIETARKALATKRMTGATLTPEDEALDKQLNQAGQQSLQGQHAPTQQQAPQRQTQQQAVPPAAQRVVNQVYTTPKGSFRWMGNGWQPVQ